MISQHLSEEKLQMVASSQQGADEATTQHVVSCAFCREQLEVYKLIVSAINDQPKAVFNFDLADAVLEQLQAATAKKAFSLRPFIIAAFIAIPLYLFRKNFLVLTDGIPAVFLQLSVLAGIVIIVINIFKLYHTYQRQIEQLNISE